MSKLGSRQTGLQHHHVTLMGQFLLVANAHVPCRGLALARYVDAICIQIGDGQVLK